MIERHITSYPRNDIFGFWRSQQWTRKEKEGCTVKYNFILLLFSKSVHSYGDGPRVLKSKGLLFVCVQENEMINQCAIWVGPIIDGVQGIMTWCEKVKNGQMDGSDWITRCSCVAVVLRLDGKVGGGESVGHGGPMATTWVWTMTMRFFFIFVGQDNDDENEQQALWSVDPYANVTRAKVEFVSEKYSYFYFWFIKN